MIGLQIIAEINTLTPTNSIWERWQQYSATVQRLILHIPMQDRDEFVQMVLKRLEL